jgi:hypothetical protein
MTEQFELERIVFQGSVPLVANAKLNEIKTV